jgi:hypothetical protein
MKTKYITFISLLLVTSSLFFNSCIEEPLYPLANFNVQGEQFLPGCKFNLDATESIPQSRIYWDSPDWLQYRWDLNGDHIWGDTPWSYSPIFTALIPDLEYCQFVGLQVKDRYGNITEIFKEIESRYLRGGYSLTYRDVNGLVIECINYKDCNQVWTPENIINVFMEEADNKLASYFNWEMANKKMSDLLVLPSLQDWTSMIERCGGVELAGYNMTVDLYYGLHDGFYNGDHLSEVDKAGYYWTSTEATSETAYAIKLTKGVDKVEIVQLPKSVKLSVRLFQNYSTTQSN